MKQSPLIFENFFKKPQKGLLRKAVLVVLYSEGMRVPGKGMEGGQNKVPELG